jgi:hypothetical protein
MFIKLFDHLPREGFALIIFHFPSAVSSTALPYPLSQGIEQHHIDDAENRRRRTDA